MRVADLDQEYPSQKGQPIAAAICSAKLNRGEEQWKVEESPIGENGKM